MVDAREANLKREFSKTSTQLYDRLLELFGVVDKGSTELNVPMYNGGLFLTEVEENDPSPEARNARFLLECKIMKYFQQLIFKIG